MTTYLDSLDPDGIVRQITDLQTVLVNSPPPRPTSSTSPQSPPRYQMCAKASRQSLLTTLQAPLVSRALPN